MKLHQEVQTPFVLLLIEFSSSSLHLTSEVDLMKQDNKKKKEINTWPFLQNRK